VSEKIGLSVSKDSEFLKMPEKEFTDWCLGKLLVSIGRGEFRDELLNIIRFSADRRVYYFYKRTDPDYLERMD
jgi:hypothetical protein